MAWAKLSAILEPENLTRRIYGFDTFDGFPTVAAADANVIAMPTPGAMKADSHAELQALIREFDPDVIGVDEAQFFDDSIGWVLDLIAHQSGGVIGDVEIPRGLEVYAAGLDLDAWAKPFGPMPNLLAFADRVEKFTANCFQCGQDARLTQKIGGSGGRIEVGADDLYEARCVECWTPPAR